MPTLSSFSCHNIYSKTKYINFFKLIFQLITVENCITSIDDFLDLRAKYLAKRYIQNSENLPNIPLDFIDFTNRVIGNEREIIIDLDNKSTPINCLELYIKKVASIELIYFELTKRDFLVFPPIINLSGIKNTTNKKKQTLISEDQIWFPIKRPIPIEDCKIMGQYYGEIREELENWDPLIRETFLEDKLHGEFIFKIT